MPIVPVTELVRRAEEIVETLAAPDALAGAQRGEAVLVDIRDIRELEREGRVAGALHAPRGMLEFWFDPASPYHKPAFADASKRYILFCAAGWRSALGARSLVEMGFDNVAHVAGGFAALREAGAEVSGGSKAG